ncbi:MAG: succinate:quinone oxidoreductase [Planctomycetota bacterium]|nr:MAG: succinate:quinone oxidoreductase [Planctomycetota bacterium]
MNRLARTLQSSIGSKFLMSVTGILLLLFVIAHMLGNLQVFAGPDQLNAYAAKLQSLGPLLWVVRLGLLAIFVVHIGAAIRVTNSNRAARPVAYVYPGSVQSTFAGRTMMMSGLIVLAFLIYHVLHFTVGTTNPDHFHLVDETGRHDVYSMVVMGFSQWPIALVYVVANILVGVHISHGASSAFQTLGVTHPRLAFLKQGFGPGIATLIVVGNLSMPLACLFGLVQLPA